MSDARIYTGEFPPGGPQTADDLVFARMGAVERCRIKYGSAVRLLADATDVSPQEALAAAGLEATRELIEYGHYVVAPERGREGKTE